MHNLSMHVKAAMSGLRAGSPSTQLWHKGLWHAELILAAKEQNKSGHSSGRKNAMQMLLEAKDEDGAMVCKVPLQLFLFCKVSIMLVLSPSCLCCRVPCLMYCMAALALRCAAFGKYRHSPPLACAVFHAPYVESFCYSLPWSSSRIRSSHSCSLVDYSLQVALKTSSVTPAEELLSLLHGC